jgi:hypothetical protein
VNASERAGVDGTQKNGSPPGNGGTEAGGIDSHRQGFVPLRAGGVRAREARAAISSTHSGRLVADVADFFFADSGSGRTLARSAALVPAGGRAEGDTGSSTTRSRQIRSTARGRARSSMCSRLIPRCDSAPCWVPPQDRHWCLMCFK